MSISATQVQSGRVVVTRARVAWLTAVQVAAVALLALALAWAVQPGYEGEPPVAPARHLQALLGVLALALLTTAIIPAWRRSALAGVLGGVTLATACWLTEWKSWETPQFAYIPQLAFVALGLLVVMAAWGAIARGGLRDTTRVGIGALAGGLLAAALGTLLFFLFKHSPAPLPADMLTMQWQELLGVLVLYPAALWLGAAGLRPETRWAFQPLLMALVVLGFFVYWSKGM